MYSEAEAKCLCLYGLHNATNAANALHDAHNVQTKYLYTTKSEYRRIHVYIHRGDIEVK